MKVSCDAPERFKDTYFLIVQQQLIPLILRLQRFVKRRAFGRWLMEQNAKANKGWRG